MSIDQRVAWIRKPSLYFRLHRVPPIANHDVPNFCKTSSREVKGSKVRKQGLGPPTLIDRVDIQEEPATNNRSEHQPSHPA